MATGESLEDQYEKLDDLGLNTGPIYSVNLLRYNVDADYSDRIEEAPCSGREAYQRYLTLAVPQVVRFNGKLLFKATAKLMLKAPYGETWDEIVMVEWPAAGNLKSFLQATQDQDIRYHRVAALNDYRVFIFERELGDLIGSFV